MTTLSKTPKQPAAPAAAASGSARYWNPETTISSPQSTIATIRAHCRPAMTK